MKIFDWLVLLTSNEEQYIRYQALKGADLARQPVWIGEKKQTLTNGLRVIRRFERINHCTFNLHDVDHVFQVTGMASHEAFFREHHINFNKGVKE